MMTEFETEDQRIERVQQRRVQMALQHLPEALAYVRSIATNGQVERGETLPEWSAPMRIKAADDSDEVYANLINWVVYFAEDLKLATPSTAAVAWRNFKDTQGFRAGTSPEGALFLTKLQTMWLLVHFEQILAHPYSDNFRKNILELEGALRGAYPRTPGKPKQTHSRPCPVCKVAAVAADWFSSDPLDVRFVCTSCGYEVPPAQVQDEWLAGLDAFDVDDDEEEDLLPEVARRCSGSKTCTAAVHIHGCKVDFGRCDKPERHS